MDVDECLNIEACGVGAICRNIEGGYECSCPPGYEGDPRVMCRDLEPCLRAACGRGALCENHPDAHRCVCPPGFEGDPNVQCNGKLSAPRASRSDFNLSFSWTNAFVNS